MPQLAVYGMGIARPGGTPATATFVFNGTSKTWEVEPPPNLPALESIEPMTLDYQRVADRLEEVIRRLQPILGL